MTTIKELRELAASNDNGCGLTREQLTALLDIAEAAAKIARIVGSGDQGAARLVTAGECKELWDALARLAEVKA